MEILNDRAHELTFIEKSIRNLFEERGRQLTILEAGCGRRWPLKLDGVNYKLIGVDLDEDALKARVKNKKDLDEAIVADLQTFNLDGRTVDVIYNSYVLEHVEHADAMLNNFAKTLKPGGLMILKLPDRNSVFGFIARMTPFRFHVLYWKYFHKEMNAGNPGFGPYPTYYHRVVSRDGIKSFCVSNGFQIEMEYGTCEYLQKKSHITTLVKTVAILVNALSLGQLPWKHDSLTYILKKDAAVNLA